MVKGVIAEVAVFPVSAKAVCSKVHHSNGELCSSYTQARNLKEYDRNQCIVHGLTFINKKLIQENSHPDTKFKKVN